MIRRRIQRGLLKFSFYWVVLVASCLIVFVISALHMTVKPLQFQAPVSSVNDIFFPDVCPSHCFRSYHHSIYNLPGQSYSGSRLCRSNIKDDCHELVSGAHQFRLLIKYIQDLWRIHTAVSEQNLSLDIMDWSHKWRTLMDMSSPSWSAQLEDQPAFRLNSTRLCLEHQEFASFRTITKLVASKKYVSIRSMARQSSFQSYPFDVYV